MRQDCHLTPGDGPDHAARTDPRDQDRPVVDAENIADLGRRARQEAERFINGHIGDSTKGWPVRSHAG